MVILVPLAVILVTLAVTNRGLVPFTFDPFNPGSPSLTLSLPLFVWLLLALGLGVALGSLVTWMSQGTYRSLARRHGRDAAQLRSQVGAASRAVLHAPRDAQPLAPSQSFAALPKPQR